MTNTSVIILSNLVAAVLSSSPSTLSPSSSPSTLPPSSSSSTLPPSCYGNYSCVHEGQNLLDKYSSVPDVASCHNLCLNDSDCSFFTHYSALVTPSLANTCFIFSSCDIKNTVCHGCTSGRRDCSAGTYCPALQTKAPPRGGTWRCLHHPDIDSPAPDQTECFYFCSSMMMSTTCLSGKWTTDGRPSDFANFTCPCHELPPKGVNCYPRIVVESGVVDGGTKCVKECQGEVVAAATCQNGDWTSHLPDSCSVDSGGVSVGLVAAMATLAAVALVVAGVIFYFLFWRSRRRPRQDSLHTVNPRHFHNMRSAPSYREHHI